MPFSSCPFACISLNLLEDMAIYTKGLYIEAVYQHQLLKARQLGMDAWLEKQLHVSLLFSFFFSPFSPFRSSSNLCHFFTIGISADIADQPHVSGR